MMGVIRDNGIGSPHTIMQNPLQAVAVSAALALGLSACATFPRLDPPDISRSSEAAPIGFPRTVRFSGFDAASFESLIKESTLRSPSIGQPPGGILALSGGGSGGAFGAGVVVGLTRTGSRPRFDVVTGVSTGALVAPFAFLGPAWDAPLEEAFTGGLSSNLLASFGIGSLFDTGLYRGAPLRELVDRFVTPQLIDAVAIESKTGRLLLIVTTNLDNGEAVVWNMGAIAETGGEQARGLFRNILIASASVPGVFPPVMIRVEHGGRVYEEMHADGGATIPFFVAAASPFIAPEQGPDRDVFVIVNGTLSAPQQTTRRNTVAIALQGFSALLYQTFRSELLRLQTLVEATGSTFRYTAVPRTYPYGGTLDFNREDMRRLFNYGTACATAGELWIAKSTTRAVANEPPRDACPASNSAAVFAAEP